LRGGAGGFLSALRVRRRAPQRTTRKLALAFAGGAAGPARLCEVGCAVRRQAQKETRQAGKRMRLIRDNFSLSLSVTNGTCSV